jgi:hypothetical protein
MVDQPVSGVELRREVTARFPAVVERRHFDPLGNIVFTS